MKRRQIVKQNQTKKTVSKNHVSFRCKKRTSKTGLLYFFPSNAYGSRQVVYQAGKPVAFCKIHRINAVATSLWRQCASKRRAGWDRYMIHWAVTVQSKKKTNKNKKTPKNTQNTEPATKTPQDTTQTRYGWWSAGQLIGIETYQKRW